ncbi:MAG: hypothetical protein AABZ31_06050, partial [Bdellovibrionota bacterium]
MAFNDSFNTGHASLIFLQKQKEAYYAAEGTRAVSLALTGDYLGTDDTPTAAELTDYLKLKLAPTLPPKYKIVNVQAEIAKEEEVIEIPSGPYKGFLAPQSKVHISYEVKTADDYQGGRTSTFIDSTSIIAQVGVFQFMIFADSTDTRFVPGPAMTINGRFHTNGNVCFGNANATLALHSVSASGSVRYAKLCNPNETATKNVAVATDGTMTNFAPLRMDNSHGCTNCAGSGMDWAEYALATWHGR